MHLLYAIAIWFLLSLLLLQGNESQNTRKKLLGFSDQLDSDNNTAKCTSNYTFLCDNGACVTEEKVCDSFDDCGDKSDENIVCKRRSETCWSWQSTCSADGNCNSEYFQCDNGKCINFTLACNGENNCGDNSDEKRSVPGLKCIFGQGSDICVLPQRYVNDSITHCKDEADACFNVQGIFDCFVCFDKRLIIAPEQICDGVFDCHDLSDECLCEKKTVPRVCNNLCLRRRDDCKKGTFQCQNDKNTFVRIKDICNKVENCPNGVDEEFCNKFATPKVTSCAGNKRNATTVTAFLCDGHPECFDLKDECGVGCENEQPFCELQNELTSSTPFVIRCGNGYRFTKLDICNGVVSPCQPPIEVEELNCTARFYCTQNNSDVISIDKALVCNGYYDCADRSDESDCPDRFYCETGIEPVSVPTSFMFDDVWDCGDGSDECPISLDKNVFSSRKEMIANGLLRAWLWIMAVTALIGNAYIIYKTAQELKQLKKLTAVAKSNHFLIFNLAVADCLMGVYLIILAGYSAHFSGTYCYEDEQWRTSYTCSALGALSVIASESSVCILSVLTAVRLYSVFQPFKSRHMKLRYVFATAVLAWAVAVTLAVLPLASRLSDVVIDGAWIPSKLFVNTTVSLSHTIGFARIVEIFAPNATLLTNSSKEIISWSQLQTYLHQNTDAQRIHGFFRYYSLNSVCISKLFVTKKQNGWQFSIAIILFNLALFLFVAISYLVIYKRSSSQPGKTTRNNDKSRKMQYKIIKLIATDFACWVPICTMALIHFSEATSLEGTAYVVTAVVLLPINSVLNPLLYSNAFENLWKKTKSWVCENELFGKTKPSSISSKENTKQMSQPKSNRVDQQLSEL